MSWWVKISESGGKLKTLVESATETLIPREESPRSIVVDDDNEIAITKEVEEYVFHLTEHPATFTDFPISKHKDVVMRLSPPEERHAKAILATVPELSELRYNLCPRKMPEEVFWRVYFLLLLNKTGRKTKEQMTHVEGQEIDVAGMDVQALEKHFESVFAKRKAECLDFDDGVEASKDNWFTHS